MDIFIRANGNFFMVRESEKYSLEEMSIIQSELEKRFTPELHEAIHFDRACPILHIPILKDSFEFDPVTEDMEGVSQETFKSAVVDWQRLTTEMEGKAMMRAELAEVKTNMFKRESREALRRLGEALLQIMDLEKYVLGKFTR